MSESLKQAAKEIKNQHLNVCDGMTKIAYSFISLCQLSIQEAVYNVLLELWLRKCSPGISFINTNLPDNRIMMIKSKEELELLPDNSTDIFKKSIIDRYMDRPTCRMFAPSNALCLAQFASLYYKKTFSDNDYQPNILEENIEKENDCNTTLPKKIVLKNSREFMVRRNQKLVLRYYKPNRQLYPEKFAYHVLLLFYPFINESDLFSKDGTYSSKLLEPLVSATVNQNRQIFEPNSELIDSLLLEISKQDQEEHLYDDRQEHDNQEIESSENESSSGSIGQPHRQPDVL